MGFKIKCPNCGLRNAYEFSFESEEKKQPESNEDLKTWRHYLYFGKNHCGPQEEWWCHTAGCGCWIKIKRDTSTNLMLEK